MRSTSSYTLVASAEVVAYRAWSLREREPHYLEACLLHIKPKKLSEIAGSVMARFKHKAHILVPFGLCELNTENNNETFCSARLLNFSHYPEFTADPLHSHVKVVTIKNTIL